MAHQKVRPFLQKLGFGGWVGVTKTLSNLYWVVPYFQGIDRRIRIARTIQRSLEFNGVTIPIIFSCSQNGVERCFIVRLFEGHIFLNNRPYRALILPLQNIRLINLPILSLAKVILTLCAHQNFRILDFQPKAKQLTALSSRKETEQGDSAW